MSTLTKSQKQVLDFVTDFIVDKGYAPTFRDIQTHFNFASLGSVHTYIKTLKLKGFLQTSKRSAIALAKPPTLPSQQTSDISLPFIGYIAAGFPIEMFPQSQSLTIPLSLVPNPDQTYLLRVRGDTLIDEHILDGDLLIVEAKVIAQEGELIIGEIHKNDTLIKRYFPEGSYIRLEGRDGKHQPIIIKSDEFNVQGAVIGLIRGLLR